MAISFGLAVDNNGPKGGRNVDNNDYFRTSWTLFFLVALCLTYSGISLCLHIYKASTDALYLAFGTSRGANRVGKVCVYEGGIRWIHAS